MEMSPFLLISDTNRFEIYSSCVAISREILNNDWSINPFAIIDNGRDIEANKYYNLKSIGPLSTLFIDN